MSHLSKVLALKILATLGLWALPLMVFPASVLEAMGFPPQPSYLFPRLLGWAYLALCVGYGFGWRASVEGKRPNAAIWMGIVSNGGACGNLVVFGLLGSYSQWGKLAQVFVWGSAAVTGLVALSLYAYGVREGARETES